MLRVYFYFFVSINFFALTCLFIVSFVNVIFIREEHIIIPEIKSSSEKNFIIPSEVRNDDYNFKILNHDNDDYFEKLNSKSTEFNKDIDTKNLNLLNKKSIQEKKIKKYIVQLGVFKNKKNADNQLLVVNNHKGLLFKEIKINVFKTNDKKNNLLYFIETNEVTKINATSLCNFFKNKKINCIIKIKK